MNTPLPTVCVPTYTRYDLCAEMLASAAASDVAPRGYLVVDNGGGFEPPPGLADAPGTPLRVFRPGRNIGVAASWNWFLRHGEGLLLVCNDDVRLASHTIGALLTAKSENPDELVVYPAQDSGEANALSVFLLDPKAADFVGYFDESFHPAYFEDNDYLYRMKLRGLRPFPVWGCGYFHHCSATLSSMTGAERDAHFRNFELLRAYYVAKWGGDPGAERFTRPFAGDRPAAADGSASRVLQTGS